MSSHARVQEIDFLAPPAVQSWQQRALVIGIAFGIASLIGAAMQPAQAMHSFLLAYMFWIGFTLGSMAMLMVWHLTGGDWGVGIRRILEAATGTLPLMAVLFLVILLGLRFNYAWARPDFVHDEHTQNLTSHYLNFRDVLIRGLVYFAGWWVLMHFLLRWSDEQDRPEERPLGMRFRALSGLGLAFYGWSMTFASIDWVMSLEAPWPSSIFALVFMVSEGMCGICLCVIVGRALQRWQPMQSLLRPHNFQDHGKLLLMFVMLWGWFSYSQWLIIWAGNLPEEIKWFAGRIHGDWGTVALILIVGHFAIPFALLLSRGLKRDGGALAWVAGWLLLMAYLDAFWYIAPAFHRDSFYFSWLDAVEPIALGGLWLAYFFRNLKSRPLAALHDPQLRALLEKEHE